MKDDRFCISKPILNDLLIQALIRHKRSEKRGAGHLIECLKKGYNTIIPHSSLSYRPPDPETLMPNTFRTFILNSGKFGMAHWLTLKVLQKVGASHDWNDAVITTDVYSRHMSVGRVLIADKRDSILLMTESLRIGIDNVRIGAFPWKKFSPGNVWGTTCEGV